MEALENLLTRTSAGALQEPAPEGAALEKILASAVRAPDHGRIRPWRFFLVRNAARERLGELLAQSLRRRDPKASPAALENEKRKPLRAPLIVVLAAKLRDHPKVPRIEQVIAAGAAGQNVMLAAHASGFGAMWRTGEAAYDPFVKAAFGLAPEDALVGFLYLGTPVKPAPAPPEADVSSVVVEWTA